MWTLNNNVFFQFNISIEIYQGWCAMCWRKIMLLVPLLIIMPPDFKQVLCGRILFVDKSIFYTTKSFVAIAILAIVMGDKL
jgi:hypothetical protein